MREWLLRLRTALAVAAAVFLGLQLPALYHSLRTPMGEPAPDPSPMILRVWLFEDFSGSALSWLSKQAAAFEKAHRDTRVVVRRAQRGDWAVENVVPPDLLLFEAGAVDSPEGLFAPLNEGYPLKPFLEPVGEWRGGRYAVPIAYTGYVLLTNEEKPDGPALHMQTDKEYQEFAAGQAGSLIATPREARRLAALQANNKGVPFAATPHSAETDKLLLAARFSGEVERAGCAKAFLLFLLADPPQNALPEAGLLPASKDALPPDAEKQPLLHALGEAVGGVSGGVCWDGE